MAGQRSDQKLQQDFLCSSAPRLAVTNIRIDDRTTFSLRVSWQPPHTSSLQHYRLSYSSAGGPEETVSGRRSGTTQSSR